MNYETRLSISYYKTIATLYESHKVYLVMHQATHRIYVKKILDVYSLRVYDQLKSAHIPGIPDIVEYCEDNHTLILIEEYVNGKTLLELIEDHELTPELITSCLLHLCDTLSALHSMQPPIIHRDIKPSNIILTRDLIPVLIDFNAAKNFSASSDKDTVLLGTQGYAAPEQYGFGSSTLQTDIYSLGILLKEMVQSLNAPLSDFDTIIARCTQMNPKDRYASVTELKNAVLSSQNRADRITPDRQTNRFLPPGFRTHTPWKMALGTLGYVFIFWLSLTLQVDTTSSEMLFAYRISCLGMLLSIVFGCFNYGNIQKFVPLCQSKNRIIRYLGILLLVIALIAGFILLLSVVENILVRS